jgi:hypothetical protein
MAHGHSAWRMMAWHGAKWEVGMVCDCGRTAVCRIAHNYPLSLRIAARRPLLVNSNSATPPCGMCRGASPSMDKGAIQKKTTDPDVVGWLLGSSEAEKVPGSVSSPPDFFKIVFLNSPHRETPKNVFLEEPTNHPKVRHFFF